MCHEVYEYDVTTSVKQQYAYGCVAIPFKKSIVQTPYLLLMHAMVERESGDLCEKACLTSLVIPTISHASCLGHYKTHTSERSCKIDNAFPAG